MEELRRELSSRSLDTQRLAESLAERDVRVEELERSVAERNARIENLESAFATVRGEQERASSTLAARDGQIADLQSALATQQADAQQRSVEFGEAGGQAEKAKTELFLANDRAVATERPGDALGRQGCRQNHRDNVAVRLPPLARAAPMARAEAQGSRATVLAAARVRPWDDQRCLAVAR